MEKLLGEVREICTRSIQVMNDVSGPDRDSDLYSK
jgi:hypothetical protein